MYAISMDIFIEGMKEYGTHSIAHSPNIAELRRQNMCIYTRLSSVRVPKCLIHLVILDDARAGDEPLILIHIQSSTYRERYSIVRF